jgi:hypothetical protein
MNQKIDVEEGETQRFIEIFVNLRDTLAAVPNWESSDEQ